jgi:hypothetical protein
MNPIQPSRRQVFGALFTALFGWLWPSKATAAKAMPKWAFNAKPQADIFGCRTTFVYDGKPLLSDGATTMCWVDPHDRLLKTKQGPPPNG